MSRVLIVDDQPDFRRRLSQLLTRAGFTVVGEAGSIAEAVDRIRARPPDLAVVDVVLPGIDGIEGTRHLKTVVPDLRVILISAYRDQAGVFRSAAEEVGAEAFFSKDDLDLDVVRAWR